jgi:chromosome segregation ATPase
MASGIKFTPEIKKEIIKIIDERIREAHVTKEDFTELKNIVAELAKAQIRTEKRIAELAEAQKRTEEKIEILEQKVTQLAEAQKKTEERVDSLEQKIAELVEAQIRTEKKIAELAEAQKRTEERLNILEQKVAELVEAQIKTEKRLEILEQKVAELAEAQKKTEERLNILEQKVTQLAEAQKRTEEKVAELAEAQKKSESAIERLSKAVENLTIQVNELAIGLDRTRKELGGLERSISYAQENEAFRMLPKFLKEKYNIEIKDRLIRTEIGGKEINIFGSYTFNGTEGFIVGEVKLRLENKLEEQKKRRNEPTVFDELEEKVKAVKTEYKTEMIKKILVTHFADKEFLKTAKEKEIIVVQTFEW